MAVSFDSFSIRAYASKMRSVDSRRSWPFKERAEDLRKEKIDDLLPPIVCRKYRWWSDELESERRKVLEGEEMEVVENIGCLGLETLPIDERNEVVGADEDPTVKIRPVCGMFAATTVNAVNVHIDGGLVEASREKRRQMRARAAKGKARAPKKKRSIAEIFALAPPMDRLDEDEEDNREEEVGEERSDLGASLSDAKTKTKKGKLKKQKLKKAVGVNEHSIKKKKKMKATNVKKFQNTHAIKTMKMKTKKQPNESPAMSNRLSEKKEKILKLMTVQFELDGSELQQSSLHNRRPGNEIGDLVHKKKKTQSKVKTLPKKNQLQIVNASELFCKMQEPPVLALHSILKNHSRVTKVQKSTETGNLQGSNLAKHHSLQHSGKHVRFSGDDEIIGLTTKQCSSELPLSVKDLSVESDEPQEVNRGDDAAALSIVNDREAQSSHEKEQWVDPHGPFVPPASGSNSSCHDIRRTSLGVDLNQAFQNSENLHLFKISSSVSPHNLLSVPKTLSCFPKGVAFEENQAEGSVQRPPNTSTRMRDPFAYPNPRSAVINSLTSMTRNSTSQPLLSCLMTNMERNEEQPNLLPAARKNYNGCTLHYPKDLTGSNCSSAVELNSINRGSVCEIRHFGEPGVISDPLSMCRDKWIDEDFVGLPLNSDGELIRLQSSGTVGYGHLFRKQYRTATSVTTLPMYYNTAHNRSQMEPSNKKEKLHFAAEIPSLRWLPQHKSLLENPAKAPVSSRPGFTKSQTVVTEIHAHDKMRETDSFMHPLDSHLDLLNVPSHGRREYGQPQNHAEKEITLANSDSAFLPTSQPTMRLMGKNVTVGKSSIEGQGFQGGKVWTDKEIITENHPDITVSGKSISEPCFQKEWIACSASGASKGHMFDSVEAERNPKPPSLHQITASAEPKFAHTHLNRNTHLMSVDGGPLVGGKHGSEFRPFRQTFPSRSLLNEASICQTESVNMAHQMPMRMSDPHKSHRQNVLLKSSQFRQNSSMVYNPPPDFNFTFPNQDCGEYMQPSRAQFSSLDLHPWLLQDGTQQKEILYTSHPCDFFGKHHPHMRPSSNVLPLPSPYAIPPISFHAHNTDPSHSSLVHHPSIPAISGFRPSSTTSSRLINMGQKSYSTCLKDPNGANQAQKRHQQKSDELSIPMKKPNLEMQKDLNSLSGFKKREHMPGYTWYNAGTPDFHIHNDKPVDAGVSLMEIDNDESTIASGANAVKLDGVARLGPMKLSAGAKHILRPSQNTDQDKGRPTHSTIRFTAVDDSSTVPEFQEKTAKIYRF